MSTPANCTDCTDTGYLADGTWCSCPARPFEPGAPTPPDATVVDPQPTSRAEHALHLIGETANHVTVVTEIDDLMRWCRWALGPVIALGTLAYYADRRSLDAVAPHVLSELDRLEGVFSAAAPIIRNLRLAALDHLGEAAA